MRIIRASFRRGEQVGRWWNIRCRFSLVRGRRALPWSCGGHEKAARAGAGASTAAVAVVIAAPPASADTPGDADSPSVLAATGSAASDVLGSCADELGAGRRRHRPRLVAALELGDVSESAGPGSFDHTPAADEASSESEPAEDIAPKPAEDEATGTGEAGTTTEEQSEPTDPAGVEAPSPEGPSPEANTGTAAATGEREAEAAATPSGRSSTSLRTERGDHVHRCVRPGPLRGVLPDRGDRPGNPAELPHADGAEGAVRPR